MTNHDEIWDVRAARAEQIAKASNEPNLALDLGPQRDPAVWVIRGRTVTRMSNQGVSREENEP